MRILHVFLLITFLTAGGAAQTHLIRHAPGSLVTAEVLLPLFEQPSGGSFSGTILLLSGDVRVSDLMSLRAELPYIHSSSEFGPQKTSDGALANLYAGIGIGRMEEPLSGEVGVRVSTMPENSGIAVFAGLLGDFPNAERYLSEATTIRGTLNVHPAIADEFKLLLYLSPSIWIPKQGDAEWVSSYGAGVSYEDDVVRVGTGVNGLWFMSEDAGLFGNKNALHHFQAEANVRFGMVRPGVFFRIPLDEELDVVNVCLGFSMGLVL